MEAKISREIIKGYMCKLQKATECDVSIVGAGPSGLMAGYLLARKNLKVVIFESKLAPGGGIWGGAMLFNEVVLRNNVTKYLDELKVRYSRAGGDMVRADSVELASALIYRAVNAGVCIFNGITVEDVVYREDRVCGVVINFTPVLLQGLHVDPMAVNSEVVLDATGHGATLTEKVVAKTGIKLATSTGGVIGEKPLWAEVGDSLTVENTKEIYPGLFVSGMAANAVFGSARMGPIFSGMLLSGVRAAELIILRLRRS
jgi:thiamine thiazole synthase